MNLVALMPTFVVAVLLISASPGPVDTVLVGLGVRVALSSR